MASESVGEGDAGDRGVITFSAGRELLGAGITNVREILKIHLRSVTPVYRVPDFLLGFINLRGQIKPVVDLAGLLGLAGTEPKKPLIRGGLDAPDVHVPAVVLAAGEREIICMVDRVDKVEWFPETAFLPLSSLISADLARYLSSTVRTGAKPIAVLDVPSIVNSPIWEPFR